MNLEHVTHAEAVALLKTAEQNITLELEYDVTIHEEMEDICGPILVEIQKPVGGSLGITLTGSQIPGEPIFISHIKDAGIADRCGALHIGDQVLSINGQSLTQCTLPHAVRLLINSSTPLRLELLPCSQLPPGNSEMVPPQLNVGNNRQGHQPDGAPSSSQMVRQRSVNSATGIGTGTLTRNHSRRQSVGSMQGSLFAVTSPVHLCHTEQLHVDLTPDSFGYGFMIKGIVEASVGPFVVTSIESDSPAQQHGEFMIGDRIMFINGRCTEAMPLEQAWNIVNEATESLALETEFDVAESVIPGTGTFDVKLVKQSGALGITINGHDEKGGPIWISQVKKGGVAHRTGTLEPGDVLLAVDGKSLKGATLHHAVKLLKTTADIVTLQISKDAATLGPPGSIVFAVELVRRGASLGITVHGSDNPGDPIIVSYLKEDGVAFRSATLKIGDRILAINNVNLRMHTLADAVKLLQNAGDVVTLKICREPNIAPDRGTQSLPADPCSQPLDRPLYSHGDVNEFTCPPGDYRDSSLSPQPHTLPRISHSPSSDRALQRLLAMLALKQSGQSTPDMQSLAGSPEYNRMFETHPWSKSEALHKNFLIPDINLPSDDGSDHSLHAQLANSGDHHVGNSGNCSASDTNHSLSHTLPKQATKWVGHSDQTSHSLINSTQDGYATWGGRKQTVPTAMAGTLNQGVDEIREKGFGELKPLNHALEQAVSRQQRLAVKDTSSDSDSPSVISKARGGKPPPKPRRRFDKHIKAFAYMPTSVFVKKVVLQRKSSVSDFGFSVADGATEPGVFVKAVRADGPAMDKLKAFDKILQVNDVNVHDSDCCRVVPLIAQAGHLLSLIITRRKQAHKVDAESKGSTS
jgi:C-terminal processing protease CtpA/Prc